MALRTCITFTLFFACIAAGPARAETCKYVDSEGRVTYSNVPVKDARKVSCFEPLPPATPPTAPAAPKGEAAPRTEEGARKAKVAAPVQRKRDDERRGILQTELAKEEQALAEAKRALSEQESVRNGDERNYARVLERLKPYQEAVDQHERNVASIKQELANLR